MLPRQSPSLAFAREISIQFLTRLLAVRNQPLQQGRAAQQSTLAEAVSALHLTAVFSSQRAASRVRVAVCLRRVTVAQAAERRQQPRRRDGIRLHI